MSVFFVLWILFQTLKLRPCSCEESFKTADDEESDSSDSFVVAFEAHHLQTLEKVSGERATVPWSTKEKRL